MKLSETAIPIAAHPGAPLARQHEGWVEITLNRPAEHNRIDPADLDALLALLAALGAESGGMRALLITGAGERTFSSGYTLQAIETAADERFERLLDTIETLPFVTIALLNGNVYGGATDLALCCDIRIGVPGIGVLIPAARLGVHFYPGGLRRCVTRLGLAAASRLLLTGMAIDAEEMLRIGFLSEMVERGSLEARIARLREAIAQTEPGAVAAMKRHLLAFAGAGVSAAQIAEMGDAYRASLASPDLRRRLEAWRGGRRPKG